MKNTYSRKQNELIGLLGYKLNSLEAAIDKNDVLSSIEAGGIVRDLMLSDENGIFGAIFREVPNLRNKRNRSLKFQVKFFATTRHSLSEKGLGVKHITDGAVTCEHGNIDGIFDYNRDSFLKVPVFCTEYGHFTNKDIISFTANKLGARHFDHDSEESSQMILREIRDSFGFKDFDPVLYSVRNLSSVVLKTGRGLLDRIECLGR